MNAIEASHQNGSSPKQSHGINGKLFLLVYVCCHIGEA